MNKHLFKNKFSIELCLTKIAEFIRFLDSSKPMEILSVGLIHHFKIRNFDFSSSDMCYKKTEPSLADIMLKKLDQL